MNYVYIRVSTDKQSYERQIANFNERGYELYTPTMEGSAPTPHDIVSKRKDVKVFCEKFTGTRLSGRKQLLELIENLEENDVLVVDSLSRLARSMKSLIDILEMLNVKGVGFISLKEDLDLSTATGKLMFNLIGAINQFERDITSERTKETLQAKKANGEILGRPVVYDHKAIVETYMNDETLSYNDLVDMYGITKGQISNIMKKFNVDVKTRTFLEN